MPKLQNQITNLQEYLFEGLNKGEIDRIFPNSNNYQGMSMHYHKKFQSMAYELSKYYFEQIAIQNNDYFLWLIYIKFLYSCIECVPKSIIAIQQLQHNITYTTKTMRGLKNYYLRTNIINSLYLIEMQILTQCYYQIKIAQQSQQQLEFQQAFEIDEKQNKLSQNLWLLLKMKEEILNFLKTLKHEDCSEIIITALTQWNIVKTASIDDITFLLKIHPTLISKYQAYVLFQIILQDPNLRKTYSKLVNKDEHQKDQEVHILEDHLIGLVSVSLLELGKIYRHSNSLIKVLSTPPQNVKNSLIHENINTLLPNIIARYHDDMIQRYLDRGSKVLIRTADQYFPMLNKKGFIIKTNVQFTLNTNIFDDFIVDAQVQVKNSPHGFALLDLTGKIINVNEEFFNFLTFNKGQLDFNQNIFQQNKIYNHICFYIPSLLEFFDMSNLNNLKNFKQQSYYYTIVISKLQSILSLIYIIDQDQTMTTFRYNDKFLINFNNQIARSNFIIEFDKMEAQSPKILQGIKRFYKYYLSERKQKVIIINKEQLIMKVFQCLFTLTLFKYNQENQSVFLFDIVSLKQIENQDHQEAMVELIRLQLNKDESTDRLAMTIFGISKNGEYQDQEDEQLEENYIIEEEEQKEEDELQENIQSLRLNSIRLNTQDQLVNTSKSYIEQGQSYQIITSNSNIQQKFFNSRKPRRENTFKVIEFLQSPNIEILNQDEDQKLNQLMEVQQLYNQPQSSNASQLQHIQQEQFIQEQRMDDEASIHSTSSNKNTLPILIRNAFKLQYYQDKSKLVILALIYLSVILANNIISILMQNNQSLINLGLYQLEKMSHIQTSFSSIITTMQFQQNKYLNGESYDMNSIIFEQFKKNFQNGQEEINYLFIKQTNMKLIQLAQNERNEFEYSINHNQKYSFNMSYYGFLIKEFTELSRQMLILLEKEEMNKDLQTDIIVNFKLVLRKLNEYQEDIDLGKTIIEQNINQDLVLWVSQSVSFIILLMFFYQVYDRERTIRSLLFTLNKFKRVDIDLQLDIDKIHLLQIQQTIQDNKNTKKRKYDRFKTIFKKGITSFNYYVITKFFIQFLILVSFLPIFLLPKEFQFQIMQDYLQKTNDYMLQLGSIERLTPFTLMYLSSNQNDMESILNKTYSVGFQLIRKFADPELELIKEEFDKNLCLEQRQQEQCIQLINGLLEEGLLQYLQNLKRLYEEHRQLNQEGLYDDYDNQSIREVFIGWNMIEQHIKGLCEILIKNIENNLEEQNDIILGMNISQFFCIFLLGGILMEITKYIQRRQMTSWNSIQLFTNDMLSQNEYFKTFLSRQKKQTES